MQLSRASRVRCRALPERASPLAAEVEVHDNHTCGVAKVQRAAVGTPEHAALRAAGHAGRAVQALPVRTVRHNARHVRPMQAAVRATAVRPTVGRAGPAWAARAAAGAGIAMGSTAHGSARPHTHHGPTSRRIIEEFIEEFIEEYIEEFIEEFIEESHHITRTMTARTPSGRR